MITFDVVPDTGDETALICGEVYRKGEGWKFRALGQGYATGLVGLATEYGIAVDDGEADPGPAAATAAPAAPYPAQAAQEPTSAYGYPLPAPSSAHVPAQPAYGYPAAGGGRHGARAADRASRRPAGPPAAAAGLPGLRLPAAGRSLRGGRAARRAGGGPARRAQRGRRLHAAAAGPAVPDAG